MANDVLSTFQNKASSHEAVRHLCGSGERNGEQC